MINREGTLTGYTYYVWDPLGSRALLRDTRIVSLLPSNSLAAAGPIQMTSKPKLLSQPKRGGGDKDHMST